MQISRHLLRPDHSNGEVVSSMGRPWSVSEIAKRGSEIRKESINMGIQLSNTTIGRSALRVMPKGMTWDEVFALIASAPRTYADASVGDFVGDDGTTPSVAQVFANLQREAVKRGVIVATARVPKLDKTGKPIPVMANGKPKLTKLGAPVYVTRTDVFRFGHSKYARDAARLPKWYLKLAPRSPVMTTDLEVVEAVGEEE